MLALHVDDDSGKDGAPAPMIQNIPVREAFGRWPRLDELPGLVVAVKDDAVWDAWYGNDASPLDANRLAFGLARRDSRARSARSPSSSRRACNSTPRACWADGELLTWQRSAFMIERLAAHIDMSSTPREDAVGV